MKQDLQKWWGRFRALLDTLQSQGVTNLRQFWHWSRSVDVTTAAVDYLRAHPGLQGIIYWIAAFAVGLFAVGYAWIFSRFASIAQGIAITHPAFLLILSPLGFLAAWWLVHRYSPGAAGGGIPEVLVAMESDPQTAARWTGARPALVKFASSLCCVLGGGAIGREGPTIQIAAGIFYSLGMRFKHIWPSLNHQSLLVAGGSAGIAAAFNTPLGGIVFAVEELSQQHFNRFKTFLISAVIIAGLVAQWILGPYLFLGYPPLATLSFMALPWAIAVGILCGLFGAWFGAILLWTSRRLLGTTVRKSVRRVLIIGVLMALSGWFLGAETMGGGTDLMTRVLFHENDRTVSWGVLFGRFFAPLISTAAGAAAGVFAPALAAGAAIGAKFAELTHTPYPNLVILMGMTAFLSGVTRAPFTAFVLVLEMTDRHSAIFPLMVASLLASLAAKLVDGRSFYEQRCQMYLDDCKANAAASPVIAASPEGSRNPTSGPATSPDAGPYST